MHPCNFCLVSDCEVIQVPLQKKDLVIPTKYHLFPAISNQERVFHVNNNLNSLRYYVYTAKDGCYARTSQILPWWKCRPAVLVHSASQTFLAGSSILLALPNFTRDKEGQ